MRGAWLVLIGLGACAQAPSPYMHPTARAGVVRDPASATVVFVHHAEPRTAECAPGDCAEAAPGWNDLGSPRVRIVDADGAFLGDSDAGTTFAVALAPGAHTFVGWPEGDVDAQGKGGSADAIDAELAPGRIYVVDVRARIYSHPNGRITHYRTEVALHPLAHAAGASVDLLVRGLAWEEPARAAGDVLLAGDLALPARLRAAAALASRRLAPDDGY